MKSGPDSLMYILSGGRGERLSPLTDERAKPAVPFGGSFRVIDFVLSNAYNSKIDKILIMTQYLTESLHGHLRDGWYPRFGNGPNTLIRTMPAEQGREGFGYSGTANAVYQKINILEQRRKSVDVVNVFGGDHIYFMNIAQFNRFHIEENADLTISAIPVKIEEAAKKFGVLSINENYELINFEEKPSYPTPIPNNPEYCLASMGNYVFKPDVLLEELAIDASKQHDKQSAKSDRENFTSSDFGNDIIPSMIKSGNRKIMVYDYKQNKVPGLSDEERIFWRDIGTIKSFFDTNIDLTLPLPELNIYNNEWPVLTYVDPRFLQPCKSVEEGKIKNSIVGNGVITNGMIHRSVVCTGSYIEQKTLVEDSVLLGEDRIGKGSWVSRVIIDKNVYVPEGTRIGINHEDDIARGLTVKDGITIVPKGHRF